MVTTFIVAPTHHIARYYMGKHGINPNTVSIISDTHDMRRLVGLRESSVKVLNQYDCIEEVIAYIHVLSTKSKMKLEFENV